GPERESDLFRRLIEDVKRNGTREQQRAVLDRLKGLIDSEAATTADIPPRKANDSTDAFTSKCGSSTHDEEARQLDLTNNDDLRASCIRLVAWNMEGRTLKTGTSIPIPDDAAAGANLHPLTEVGCPNCFKPIYVEVKPIPSQSDTAVPSSGPPRRPPPRRRRSRNAWVTVMYGNGADYFVGAMVLGWSLKHRGRTQHDMVLLHTADVPVEFLDSLRRVWDCREVEYIQNVSTRLFLNFKGSRFKDVFTKLRVLELTEYSKVCLLDSDMLVRDNIDEIFDLQPPAALVRGTFPPRHGAKVPVTSFWSGHRQITGINGGCMLLEPSKEVFSCMMDEVSYYNNPAHWPTCGAEQEYLTRWYASRSHQQWSHMSCRYNFQIHLNQYGSAEWHHYYCKTFPGVKIFHYSGNLCSPFEFVTDVMVEHGFTVNETIAYIAEIPLVAHREQARQVQLQRELIEEKESPGARDPGNCIVSSKKNGGGIGTLRHDAEMPDIGLRQAEALDESETENNEDTSELDFGKCLNHLSKEFPCTNPVRDAEAVIEWMLAFKGLISELPQVIDILHALRQEKQRLFEAAQLENSEAEAAADSTELILDSMRRQPTPVRGLGSFCGVLDDFVVAFLAVVVFALAWERCFDNASIPAAYRGGRRTKEERPAPVINLPKPDENILCSGQFDFSHRVAASCDSMHASGVDLCGSMEYSADFEDRWLYPGDARLTEEDRQQALAQKRMMDLLRDRGYEDISPLPDDVQGGEAWVVYCSKNGSDYVAKMKPIDNNVLIEAETLSRLQSSVTHPYIVQLCDFILTDCLLCLLFEAVHPVGMDLVE
ncbi:putative serine/threonine protein phosphatase, partial [Perkinsus olseni]